MKTRKYVWLALALVMAVITASCGDDDDSPEAGAGGSDESSAAVDENEPAVDENEPAADDSEGASDDESSSDAGTEDPAGTEAPTDLNIAAVFVIPADDPWNGGLLDALDRLAEEAPHDLNITYEFFESIDFPDAERVIGDLASSGEFGMILAHSDYSDAVSAVSGDYPDIAFSFTGAGAERVGGNNFWVGISLHEPAYLAGVAAAMLVDDDQGVGAVGGFPFPDVAAPVNGFFDGARSVNPEISTNVTFIESWFDPARAAEAATALISEGAGAIYAASAFGTFSAIGEGDGVYGVGDLADVSALAPHAVITSTVALWDPGLRVMIDQWYDQHVNGNPMDAPAEQLVFSMAEGGGEIVPLNPDLVPQEVIDEVDRVRQEILNGALVVEMRPEAEGG